MYYEQFWQQILVKINKLWTLNNNSIITSEMIYKALAS